MTDPPGFNHLDDAVLATIAGLGLLTTLLCWRELVRSGRLLVPLAAAIVLTGASVVVDSAAPLGGGWQVIEESTEFAGQTLFLAAAYLRFRQASVAAGLAAEGGARPRRPECR